MEVRASAGDLASVEADAVVVNLFEGVKEPGGATGAVDRALGGAISALIADGEASGKKGRVAVVHTLGRLPAKRVAVVGLGKAQAFSLATVREVTATSARHLRGLGARRIASIAHGAGTGGLGAQDVGEAMAEGVLLGLYTFRRHLTGNDEERREVQEFVLVERDGSKVPALQRGVERGAVLGEASALARDMVNEPANVMTPTRMAETARQVAQEHGLEVTVLEGPECEAMGMGAYMGVSRGSSQPPKFIVLRYHGDPESPRNNLALIGKSITFDSGGISIKPAEGMGSMKGDMAGGASVIAAMKAIARLRPRLNVTAIAAATENLPSGTATRPGDILPTLSGKTVEVENTDAEGRLTLADAVTYARRLGMGRLVDVATLTGAMVVGLGHHRAGVFGNHQPLVDALLRAGEASGERMWQMPLDEEYKEQNRSTVADIKNTGGRPAGSITAALFIGEFAEDTPWVHVDIAGVSMADKERGPFAKGATGIPTRSLVRLALELAGGSR